MKRGKYVSPSPCRALSILHRRAAGLYISLPLLHCEETWQHAWPLRCVAGRGCRLLTPFFAFAIVLLRPPSFRMHAAALPRRRLRRMLQPPSWRL